MAYRCRVVRSDRSRPEILSWVFAGSQVSFGLVGGGRDAQVGGEAQDVVLAVAQVFQEPLAGVAVVHAEAAGAGGQVGQAGGDAVAVGGDQGSADAGRDGGQVLVRGRGRRRGSGRRRGGDLGRPGGTGVALGGVFEVAQQVSAAQLVDQRAERGVVIDVVAVVDDYPGQVRQHELG